MFYLYVITETDGNDASKFDCIVEAENRDAADTVLGEHFEALAKEKNWESDGNWCSYYFPCDCEEPEVEEDVPADCEDCEVFTINGVACHELGCPTKSAHDRAVKQADYFECPGHGGLSVDDAKEFETEEQAENERSMWHSLYSI